MKKQLLKIASVALLLGASVQLNAQNILPEAAFGFENDGDVTFGGADPATRNGATSPSNIVNAMTQVDGFTQSSEQAQSGTYSAKTDLVAIGTTIPKLQTWRGSNGGSFFTTVVDNYTLKVWVYLVGDTPTTLRLSMNSQAGNPATAFDFTGLSKNTWHQVTANSTINSVEAEANGWFNVDYTGFQASPAAGSAIYIDNITMELTSTLSTTVATKIEGASVDASNGAITVTGANLDAVYSITGQQVDASGLASGIYIVKISKGNKQESVKVIL
ncbi:T9SS type A sorting domain-containing protein [Wenyingzhuangia sp. IMCC45533]